MLSYPQGTLYPVTLSPQVCSKFSHICASCSAYVIYLYSAYTLVLSIRDFPNVEILKERRYIVFTGSQMIKITDAGRQELAALPKNKLMHYNVKTTLASLSDAP
jgi:hypothetical protein